MIESLISALGLELGLTSKEIADVVWLALQMNEVDRPPNLVPDRREKVQQKSQPQPSAERQEGSESKPSEPQAGLYAPNYQDSASMAGALALKVPDARSMREPLSLARALKPLLRKVMTGYRMVLDETATVERIAEEGVWLPVLQPLLEPWLELALVVDESVSMQIWRRTIVELQRFMEHYGVFRDVRVWGLLTDEQGQVQIRPGMGKAAMRQGLRRPSELIDPSGRRLILVVTDCVSPLWRDGTIQPALKLWAASGPMAIVQMLPEWLWARTGLGLASTVQFQSMAAGLANQQLRVRDLSPWDDVDVETGIKVPVVTLEPERFGAWAEMMTGKGGAWATGVVFESAAIAVDLPLPQDEALDGVQRVQQFRVTASPMARQLSGLLASAPVISLPIVRIIQERLLKDSRQVHVAEVFLGGLLKPLVEITPETNVDSVQYEFLDGVRDVLLESMRTSETISVLNEVSQFVAERLGLSIDAFMAVLKEPQQLGNQELVGIARPFAIVSVQILKKLGSEYLIFARMIEKAYLVESYVAIQQEIEDQKQPNQTKEIISALLVTPQETSNDEAILSDKMTPSDEIFEIWKSLLERELRELNSINRDSIIRWLVGENPSRLNSLSPTERSIVKQAMDFRYRILKERYLNMSPDRAYRNLIQRLCGIFLIRSKIKTWISLSPDRASSVVHVLQEVIQELIQQDAYLQQQTAWIGQCTSDPRLQNALVLATTEEYCLRPVRNQPLLMYRFVNYLKRDQRSRMTQVSADFIRLVSDELGSRDESEGAIDLLDAKEFDLSLLDERKYLGWVENLKTLFYKLFQAIT